jgi:hypothetical protein
LAYTYAKKNFGQHLERNISERTQILNAVGIVGFMTDLLDPALEVFSGCFYSFDGF